MDNVKVKGTIRIYEGKKEKLLETYENLFLDVGKKALINLLSGTASGIGKYDFLVIGDGTNPVLGNDTKLGNELFRKAITDLTIIASNRLLVDTYINTDEANFTWKELGLVSGGDVGTVNTGLLLNRAKVNEQKTAAVSKTVSWDITII